MANVFPVVLSSAGRRVELLRLLRSDAGALGLVPRIVAIDSSPSLSAACAEADKALAVPPASHAEFVPSVLEICRRESARLIVPTIDPELMPLAGARDDFRALGTLAAISEPAAVAVAADKGETARVLGAGMLVPRTASPAAVAAAPGEWHWPVIAKPAQGSSSIGVALVDGPDELERLASTRNDLLVQERVAGREFTVNMFVDGTHRCRAAVPHFRREVRAGEVSKGITVRDAALSGTAHRIAELLPGLFGPVCFQAIMTPSGPCVFEINARFGGGFPLAHCAGARFTRWLLEAASGMASTANDDWQDGTWMLRYDAAVYGVSGTEEPGSAWFA